MDNAIHWLEPPCAPAYPPRLHVEAGPGIRVIHTPLAPDIIARKNEIDTVAPAGQWDDAKKITNPYEYIFLSLQRRMCKSVAAIQPLSRSYFKMIELWDLLRLSEVPIHATAHSAEGPGGFLEAIQDRTGHATPMIAMTLRSTERTIPGWRKSNAFLTRHPQVLITYGADGTGNLYSLENQAAFAATAATHLPDTAADLYTADGGFDFSADYNGQENTVQRLLVAEALAGLQTLRMSPTSTMVLKMFDTNNHATLELLWLLGLCFDYTGLVKPKTSRPANSERYWIGRGFRGAPIWVLELFQRLTAEDAPQGWNGWFAVSPWTSSWLERVRTFQQELERHQLVAIGRTLDVVRAPTRERIADLLFVNIRQSREWCRIHGIPENPAYADLTDEQVMTQNLEEALLPFQVSVARMNLPALFRHTPTHRVSSAHPPLQPPTAPAWRSALPASILGRAASQIAGGTPASTARTPSQSPPGSDHAPSHP